MWRKRALVASSRVRGRAAGSRCGRQRDGGDADDEPWTSEIYFGDVLFHGPAFRVIEDITGVSERGIDACCWGVRAVGWPTEPWAPDPALLDGALQLALLWTERLLGLASLPTAVGTVRVFSEPTFGQHAVRSSVVA